ARMKAQAKAVDKATIDLLSTTACTVAMSLDGWTSQNHKSMFAMNIQWLGRHFKTYQRCIGFTEINGSHSGEKLASIVKKALRKYSLRQKLLSITADNAGPNDTLC